MQDDSDLKEKLLDLAKIYRLTDEYLKENGMELKSATDTICELIPNSELCSSHIYIDSIETPGIQTYKMIESMLSCAKSLTISLKSDLNDTSSAFSRSNEIYSRLKSLFKENAVTVNTKRFTRSNRYIEPVFEHIETELFKFPFKKYSGDSSCIDLVYADSKKAEIDLLVTTIKNKAKKGARYRNMAVVASSSEYDVMVKRAFERENIPLFCNSSLKLSSTSAAGLINAALRCVSSRFKSRDIISLMKTGLCGVLRDEAEILENYILAYNISGDSFLSSFNIGDIPETAEDTRQKLTEPLIRLKNAMLNSNVKAKTDALLNYLNELKIKDILQEQANNFSENSQLVLSKQYNQIWKLIIDCLTQLKNIMGDSKMGIERYAAVVEEGLATDIIELIPSGIDMVSYSGLQYSMPFDAEHIFIIGAAEGALPTERKDNRLVDDTELMQIKQYGLNVWNSVAVKREQDNANMYTLLTSAQKSLYISYSQFETEDETTKPSNLITKITKMLDRDFIPARLLPYGCYNIDKAAAELRVLADTGKTETDDEIGLSWYMNNEKYGKELEMLKNAVCFNPSPAPLKAEYAKALYNDNTVLSSTRLELFNKCQFAHYVKYGLNAVERKEYKEKKVDTGNICHNLLDAFVRYVIDNSIPYSELNRTKCDEIIDTLALSTIDTYNDGVFNKNPRYKAKKSYIMAMTKDTAYALIMQMEKGNFKFLSSEITFGDRKENIFPPIRLPLPDGSTIKISGKIDRVDSYKNDDGKSYYRIIDYKTSKKEFSYTNLYEGFDLQLPLYLSAVSGAEEVGCGMFYMPISINNSIKPPKNSVDIKELEKFEKDLLKKYQLSGIVLSEAKIVSAMDNNEKTVLYKNKIEKVSAQLEKERLDNLKQYAVNKAADTAYSIKSGNASINPFRNKNKSACDYCVYKSVCMFDEEFYGCSYHDIKTISPDVIIGQKADKKE